MAEKVEGIVESEEYIESLKQELHELKMRFRVAKSTVDGFVGVNQTERIQEKSPEQDRGAVPSHQNGTSDIDELERKRLRLIELDAELVKAKEAFRNHEKEKQELKEGTEKLREELDNKQLTIQKLKKEHEVLTMEHSTLERDLEETKAKAKEQKERLRAANSLLEESSEGLQCAEQEQEEKSLNLKEALERVRELEAQAEVVRQVPACQDTRGNSEFVRLDDRSDRYRERLTMMREKYNRKRADLTRISHQVTKATEEVAKLTSESSSNCDSSEMARVKWQIDELKKKELEYMRRVSEMEEVLTLPKISAEDPTNQATVSNADCANAMVQHHRDEWVKYYKELKERSERRIKDAERRLQVENEIAEVSLEVQRHRLKLEALTELKRLQPHDDKKLIVEKEVKRVQFAEDKECP